jgi:putative transposase
MKDRQSIAHTKWECKYHVVIVPKYQHKVLYGKVKKRVGEVLRELYRYRGIDLLEGHAMVVGYLKGKNAIRIF